MPKSLVLTRQLNGHPVVITAVFLENDTIIAPAHKEKDLHDRAESTMRNFKRDFVEFENATWVKKIIETQ